MVLIIILTLALHNTRRARIQNDMDLRTESPITVELLEDQILDLATELTI